LTPQHCVAALFLLLQSDLVQRIAEMVDAKQLDGISDVRDESDRTGTRTQQAFKHIGWQA
jgi:DNA gyrase/topoisomerase IV subunit A